MQITLGKKHVANLGEGIRQDEPSNHTTRHRHSPRGVQIDGNLQDARGRITPDGQITDWGILRFVNCLFNAGVDIVARFCSTNNLDLENKGFCRL